MTINTLSKVSSFQGKRRIGVRGRKRAIQYLLSGLKTEAQIHQQYGTNRKLLRKWRLWYWRHYEASPNHSIKTVTMKNKIKTLQSRILELEKEKKELEKALEWMRIKSETFETVIRIAEEDLDLPIRKKYGAGQSDQ